ncbi:hypothetical protein K1719_005616 [Acacia pycnantha]|nr:hypothetical protein K1719_005616 [Acacia pycnantha]
MRSVTPRSMVVSGRRSFLVSLFLARTLQIFHSSLNNHNINHTIECCSPINTLSPALTSDSESSRSDLTGSPTSSSSTGYPRHDRLLPCPSPNSAPRIEHLVVSEDGPVLEYICKALDFPPSFVAELIRFGAVYYALVSPQPPSIAPQEQIRIFKEETEPSVLRKRSSIKGMSG